MGGWLDLKWCLACFVEYGHCASVLMSQNGQALGSSRETAPALGLRFEIAEAVKLGHHGAAETISGLQAVLGQLHQFLVRCRLSLTLIR